MAFLYVRCPRMTTWTETPAASGSYAESSAQTGAYVMADYVVWLYVGFDWQAVSATGSPGWA
jgi:hypothetical protein